MNKKIYLLGLCVAASATVANAQQLPNFGFERWKDACGKTTWTSTMYDKGSDFTRPGDEPADWNGSSVSSFGVTFEVCAKSENGNYVQLKNKSIVGNNIPAYLTLSNPWVFIGGSNIIDAYGYAAYGDGGSYGGVAFTNRPDAIKLRYQKTQNTEVSHVVAYLWSGEFKSNVPSSATKNGVYTYGRELIDVDRVVLGRQTENVTATGKLIAKMDKELSELTTDWTDLEIPFEYLDWKSVPEKMNVIISAADYWTRSNLQANTTLEVDDVDFVYYSTLTALEVKGEAVWEDGKYVYAMSGTELPTAEQIKATTKSQFAEAAVTVDAENAQVRIVVTNQEGKDVDGETSHTYVLQYEKAEIEGTPYAGYLNIEMAGTPLAYNQAANIEIAETGEGVCTFMLPDFKFMGQSLGDIVVENVSIIEGEDGVKTYSGSTPEDGNLVLVPGTITASVSLTGTIDASGNCDFTIDVLWIESKLPISVTFTTEMVGTDYEGYLNGTMLDQPIIVNENAFVTIAPTDVNVCTFILPDFQFQEISLGDIKVADVTVAEDGNGVKTYVGTAEGLGLAEGTITANVELNGTIDAENKVNFVIDVTWVGGPDGKTDVPINVTFTANKIPAGVEGVNGEAVAVYGVVGAVSVNGYNGVVEVYAADGRLVKSVMVDGNAEISLNGGLYIVRAGSEAYKVFVK